MINGSTEKNTEFSTGTVQLISPRGFCTGVRRALEIFADARKKFSGKIYILNELVHNHRVGETMIRQNAVFVRSLEEIPNGSTVLFGAHGVGKNIMEEAEKKGLHIIDACCPRVKRLHRAAAAVPPGKPLIIFGNPDHPEVRGVAGHAATKSVFIVPDRESIAALPGIKEPVLLCQTTRDHLEIENFTAELRKRFPDLLAEEGVCNAVFKRQQAVEEIVPRSDAVIIAGSSHSSNANRMRDVAIRMGKAAFLIDSAKDLPDLSGFRRIALGAGASTPDESVQEILDSLIKLGYRNVTPAE